MTWLAAAVALLVGFVSGWMLRRRTLVRSSNQIAEDQGFVAAVPTIRLISEGAPRAECVLSAEPIKVGRSEASFIVRSDDDSVSRLHCTVRWNSEVSTYEVCDEGSKNGTIVEGRVFCYPGERVLAMPGADVFVGGPKGRIQLASLSASSPK